MPPARLIIGDFISHSSDLVLMKLLCSVAKFQPKPCSPVIEAKNSLTSTTSDGL